jgi:hypothetical protein
MRSSGDIIPLSSRRAVTVVPPPANETRPAAVRNRRGWWLAVAPTVAAATLLVGLAIGQWRSTASLQYVPASVRLAEYRRALADVEQTCARPEAGAGPLRSHCLDQAQFLILFPECDARCRGVVDAILPRARR